jgi:hypothetical protein
MAVRATTQENNVSVGSPKKPTAIKSNELNEPDDVLTPSEGALLKKAEREMKQGKFVTLDQLHHDLARKRSSGRRKTA